MEPAVPIHLPAYIDSSTLSVWRSCKRKYFWSTLNALHPQGKSIHLIAGGAFAAGMEAARRLVFERPGNHRPLHDDLLQAAYPAFLREWGDNPAYEEEVKSFDNTFSALEAYLLQHPPETDVIQPLSRPDGRPAVEFTFSIPLDILHPETGDPILFVGRFDLLGSYNGLPCIVDEKTTSSIGFAWSEQWRLRGQFLGYLWACQQLGFDVHTAVVRGIAILRREYKFATAIEQYPQHLIDRWAERLDASVREIISAYQVTKTLGWREGVSEAAFPPVYADACTSYGGCAFVPLCSARDPEQFFGSFDRRVWDPLAKNPAKDSTNV